MLCNISKGSKLKILLFQMKLRTKIITKPEVVSKTKNSSIFQKDEK